MKDVLHIGVFNEDLIKECEAFDLKHNCVNVDQYIQWAEANGKVRIFKSYDEYLCAFLKCLSVTLMQHLPNKEVDCESLKQHQWTIFPKEKNETIDMIRMFVSQNQNVIFKAMKELVHNRQVYINNSTLEHLDAMFADVANFIEQTAPHEVVKITPIIGVKKTAY